VGLETVGGLPDGIREYEKKRGTEKVEGCVEAEILDTKGKKK